MPDPAPKPPAEDVLSSIRRLVSENIPDRPRGACSTLSRGPGPRPVAPANGTAQERAQTGAPRLVLSPAQRIETRPNASEAPMPADTEQALRSAAVVSLRRETVAPQDRRSDPPPETQNPSAEDRSPRGKPEADPAEPAGASSPDPSPQSAQLVEAHNSNGHPRDGGLGQSLAGDIFLGRFSGDPKPPTAPELNGHDATPREGSETAVPMPETGKSLEALEAELLATLDPWGSVQYPKPLPERLVQPAPVGRDAESEDEHGDSGAPALSDNAAGTADSGPEEDAQDTDALSVLVETEDPARAEEKGPAVPEAGASVENEEEGEDEGNKEDEDILRAAAVTAPSPADEGAEAPESPDHATEDSDGAIDAAGAEVAAEDAPNPLGAISPDCATSEPPAAADADARAILTAGDPPVDVASLRELVAEIVHQELQGTLGDRITRNVRQLVRREIRRALTLQQLE